MGDQTSQLNYKPIPEDLQEKKYTRFFSYLENLKKNRKSQSIDKTLNQMRIKALAPSSTEEGAPYLEHNAHTQGDDLDFRYIENLKNVCGQNVVWFQDIKTSDFYLHEMSCRKQWCPTCGGKNGTIHKTRMHSLLGRINPEKYNMRQFVFTVPDHLRNDFQSKKGLNDLFAMARRVVEKVFGKPEFDKLGHVKRYKMFKPCVSYLHVFGDEELGIFKPHINIHVLEEKSVLLKLELWQLNQIRSEWAFQLRKYDKSLKSDDVVFHYKMRIGQRRVLHALKYMSRPYTAAHYEAIQDEKLKKMLVQELNGFLHMRYWSLLANCVYKDEMDISEIKQVIESRLGLELRILGISPFDIFGWGSVLEKIDDKFYRIRKKCLASETS